MTYCIRLHRLLVGNHSAVRLCRTRLRRMPVDNARQLQSSRVHSGCYDSASVAAGTESNSYDLLHQGVRKSVLQVMRGSWRKMESVTPSASRQVEPVTQPSTVGNVQAL